MIKISSDVVNLFFNFFFIFKISLFKFKIYAQIIGSIIGFSISNAIFIFFVINVQNLIMNIHKGENIINQYYIIIIIMLVVIIAFYNKLIKIVNKNIK